MSGFRGMPGRLGPFVEGYRVRLLELGYSPGTVRHQLMELGHLGRWMESEGLDPAQLSGRLVEAYLAARRAQDALCTLTVRSFVALLGYLQGEGVLSAEQPEPAVTPLLALIEEYRRWLILERSLAPATVHRYVTLAQRFLAERCFSHEDLGVMNLTGADVTTFLRGECARLALGSAKGRVGELRSVLRFLHLRGLTVLALGDAVPPIAGWRDVGIPEVMAAGEVERLLEGVDRSDLMGARDFAILVLLTRLGLRSMEVALLELEDLDWRAGEIVIHGKGRRLDRLPMPVEVGQALADYLSREDRRRARRVFLTLRAPRRPIRPDLVSDVVRRACTRAGLPPVGAHRLRHALASELLRRGATLASISQVLRHGDLATTAVYAKVDLVRLRAVAQPWPGSPR